jgi:hypothetical protein
MYSENKILTENLRVYSLPIDEGSVIPPLKEKLTVSILFLSE